MSGMKTTDSSNSLSVLENFSDPSHFSPRGALGHTRDTLLPSAAEVDRYLERLAFFSSTEIAPFVRYCDVSVRESWQISPSSDPLSADTPYILLDALFDRLEQFPGLQLQARHIHFTHVRADILCGLPTSSGLRIF
ncbi:hypothetical protein DFH08DRAFT_969104 [Mycena albidolilacea]|uniref:Uncharacterized protein n=1 Tax=Mycena albidolilacea TaxID=1033008 RepID=A0AAD6ZHU6_9AGAR|nr:hypothetical protein DFH08DRAFT_969104 [Mycena albidolilacea]